MKNIVRDMAVAAKLFLILLLYCQEIQQMNTEGIIPITNICNYLEVTKKGTGSRPLQESFGSLFEHEFKDIMPDLFLAFFIEDFVTHVRIFPDAYILTAFRSEKGRHDVWCGSET